MCLALGKLPHELDEMDEGKYRTFMQFMAIEKAAGRLKRQQGNFYG